MNEFTIWFDIINAPQVQFFSPFIRRLKRECKIVCTTREHAENVDLLKALGINFRIVGRHYGLRLFGKGVGLLYRDFRLMAVLPDFDANISCGSISAFHVSKLRNKKCISFDDNEISVMLKPFYMKLVDYLVMPYVIPMNRLINQDILDEKLIQYGGFKENVYVADYKPDPDFLKNLPFDNFVTIRSEPLKAAYVTKKAKTIVPQLLSMLSRENVNVLYLPRHPEDVAYAIGYDNVYMPPKPLNGLDICYYSKVVLTGSGTFAREAACLGTPAVSFFPGEQLLSVDKKLVKDGLIFYSRDPGNIVEYILNSKKRKVSLSESKKVQKEVFNILQKIIDEIKSNRRVKKYRP